MSESMNNESAKVYENDNGQFISVTKEMLEKAGMKIGDELIVKVKPNQIIVEKPNSYKERQRQFVADGGRYEEEEFDWGEDVGEEKW
ncbi:hypothetical protein MT416_07740 [Mammaliicoccus sciuri]|uniref:AbrB/MazE/SpoVT family DNA-binding domain-containing protein n=1 Tax=Mammaliicoccus sciuri TaxID=1296 RepID=UPI001FB1A48D|nr:hypothetical protein [Mammaliicoccus sciuri]MCJ1749202.1 hypothetical protein [Mammaliicoccus sciuri]